MTIITTMLIASIIVMVKATMMTMLAIAMIKTMTSYDHSTSTGSNR